jgi:hypothetical protein
MLVNEVHALVSTIVGVRAAPIVLATVDALAHCIAVNVTTVNWAMVPSGCVQVQNVGL